MRIGTLFVFNLAVLALTVTLMPRVHATFLSYFWASLFLTIATVWIRPALTALARSQADKRTADRNRIVRWLVSGLAVFLVALGVWALTVYLTGVSVDGWVWGYLYPPIALLIGWFIWDVARDQLEERAARLYDSADRRLSGTASSDQD